MTFATESAEKLLDLIYDAATDQNLWRDVLTEIADRTNSVGGVLHGQSMGTKTLFFSYNGRANTEYNAVYQARHMQNPWAKAMQSQPVGRVVFSDEITDLAAVRPTLFFDVILGPHDVPHNAMIALAAKEDFRAAFNLCRSAQQGPFGEEERQFLTQLVPHLYRSIQLGFRVQAYRALQSAEYGVLDKLSIGVILLDRRSRIIYANAAASSLASDDGPLRLRNEIVTTHSAPHSQRLGELVRMALLRVPAGAMSVPRPSDGHLLTIVVSSVRGRDVGRFADLDMPDAAVLVFVVDPTNRVGLPLCWLVDAYGLTFAEAKVALAASSGLSIPEAAARLGLSPNTIKTHLRKVFAKTGTNRQAELARLMASIGLLKAPDGA